MPYKKNTARDALMLAAEELYATKGFDYVSTRDILEVAGQKNQSALQYHFGNKHGLLWAIYDTRMAAIEKRRAVMMEDAPAPGKEDPYLLVEGLIRPMIESATLDERGEYFLRLAMQSAYRPDTDMMAVATSGRYPLTQDIVSRIERHLAHLPAEEIPLRKRLVVEACLGCVWIWAQGGHREGDMETFIRTSVEMGVQCIKLESQMRNETKS